jgi:5-methylcytosine-specific restriction protein A
VAGERIRGRKLQRLRAALFSEQPLCVECDKQGRVTLATQRDHVQALVNKGQEDEANVQPLCTDCHKIKTDRDLNRKSKPKIKVGLDGWRVG